MNLLTKIKESEKHIVSSRVIKEVKAISLKTLLYKNERVTYGSFEVKELDKLLYEFIQEKIMEYGNLTSIHEFDTMEDAKAERLVMRVLWETVLIHE